jgi:hypothetical protein
MKKMFVVFALLLLAVAPLHSQWFGGGSVGIATLTGDGATRIDANQTSISLYQPQIGPAFQFFAGRHLRNYFSVQAAYGFNRNNSTFVGSSISPNREDTFEQTRTIRQQSVGFDAMIYARPQGSRLRPYVSGGFGYMHLNSQRQALIIRKGNPALPADAISAGKPYWRTAVGVDIQLRPRWQFRYTFWETVTTNPLSSQLRPQGSALFLNFLNQFGLVREF